MNEISTGDFCGAILLVVAVLLIVCHYIGKRKDEWFDGLQ